MRTRAPQKGSAKEACATPPWLGRRPVGSYLAVGIANSAPLPMLAGQRCMTLFCLV